MLSADCRFSWWARRDSNPQPRDYESPALTVELQARSERYVAVALIHFSVTQSGRLSWKLHSRALFQNHRNVEGHRLEGDWPCEVVRLFLFILGFLSYC